MFLSHEQVYLWTTFEQKKTSRGNLWLKHEIILKAWWTIFISVLSLSRNNPAKRLSNLMVGYQYAEGLDNDLS